MYQAETASDLDDFREQTGVTFPLVADQGSLYNFAFPSGTGFPYPKDVIVDKDLKIRMVRSSFDIEEMGSLVETLLAE